MNPLIPHCFDEPPHKTVSSFCAAAKNAGFMIKDFTGELFDPRYLNPWAEFVRFDKESLNGLESTEDRRSAGRHGNQHVCVRRPQVSGCDSITFSAGGLLGVTHPPIVGWWLCLGPPSNLFE
jgi:hypothetical protein